MTSIVTTRLDLADRRRAWSEAGESVAVVMTMGALHAGHAELIAQARGHADRVVVTDFLNPLQFAPGEDLDKYPRTFEADHALCRQGGVDVLFAPGPGEVYPDGDPLVRVAAGAVGDRLEGFQRPGHFDGVLTVVAKLLHLTSPHLALFGQKDAQQLWLIDRMVKDLDFGVQIVEVPTVRDADGLALSSRNTYLSLTDRAQAQALPQALVAGSQVAPAGASAVLEASRRLLAEASVDVDYVELVDPTTFDATSNPGPAILLLAARVGATRLIDNVRLTLGAEGE